MTNLNLPSGAKPIENPNSFAHQSVGNNQPAPNVWAAMPSQGPAQTQGFNQPLPSSGMGAPIPMAVSAPIAQSATQMQPRPAYQQPAPAMNTMPPIASPAMNAMVPTAQHEAAAPLQSFEPVEYADDEAAHQIAPSSAPLPSFVSEVLTLPKTFSEVWEFAERMAKCDFCPAAARSPANIFFMLAKAVGLGLPWTSAFTDFYVISVGNDGPRLGMYVNTKEAICRKHGRWTVEVDKTTGVATASGIRYADGAKATVTYDGFDASLRNRLGRDEHGNIIGLKGWADKWPDMLKVRALGRLLDRLFPDVIGGVTSVEEMNDLLFEAELRKDAAALAKEEAESKTTTALKKIRSKKSKPVEAKLVEPAQDAAAPAALPAAPAQMAEPAGSPYEQMKQGAPADAPSSLNDLISETNPLNNPSTSL